MMLLRPSCFHNFINVSSFIVDVVYRILYPTGNVRRSYKKAFVKHVKEYYAELTIYLYKLRNLENGHIRISWVLPSILWAKYWYKTALVKCPQRWIIVVRDRHGTLLERFGLVITDSLTQFRRLLQATSPNHHVIYSRISSFLTFQIFKLDIKLVSLLHFLLSI